jgi:UTP-glucose-1-phosphate uridylyltransferase
MPKMAVPSFPSYRTVLYPVARLEPQSMVRRIIDQILNFMSSRKSSLQGSGHVVLMSSKVLGENVTVVIIFVQVIVAE